MKKVRFVLVLTAAMAAFLLGAPSIGAADDFATQAAALSDGQTVTLQVAGGEAREYVLSVPDGAEQLYINLAEISGDLCLSVKYGEAPAALAGSTNSGGTPNNQIYSHANPAAGDWYVTVQGFSPGSATLSVGYSGSAPEITNWRSFESGVGKIWGAKGTVANRGTGTAYLVKVEADLYDSAGNWLDTRSGGITGGVFQDHPDGTRYWDCLLPGGSGTFSLSASEKYSEVASVVMKVKWIDKNNNNRVR